MTVELLSVGTELLMGNIVNTNAKFLAENLTKLGFTIYHQSVVGDNRERLREAVQTALGRAELVVITGGLGPTEDDITRETTAEVFGRTLALHEPTKRRIEHYFARVGRTPTDNNWRQAMVPDGARVLDNDNGTAPGLILKSDERAEGQIPAGRTAILLPGPPNELCPMYEKKVAPYLARFQSQTMVSSMVKVCGIGESEAETMLLDLIDEQSNPTIAPYAKTAEVHFRVTASAETKKEARALVRPVVKELKARFGTAVYTTKEEETLEEVLVRQLKKRGLTITAAESCTGGLAMGRLVNVAGASEVFKGGFVTYSNKAKRKLLGVRRETLAQFGAVSEETACEMAYGALDAARADVALAITGIAGPDGGTPEKPVGLVYIACAMGDEVTVERFVFNGSRDKVREQSVTRALNLARLVVSGRKAKKPAKSDKCG